MKSFTNIEIIVQLILFQTNWAQGLQICCGNPIITRSEWGGERYYKAVDRPSCMMAKMKLMATMKQYADNTSLTIVGNDQLRLECFLNEDLHHVSNWVMVNKLQLNIDKTDLMQ